MDDAKRAIMCAAVCPCIRTVLIRGGPGSAKTVLSRAAGRLTGRRVVNVPLNVTEEMLFGGMDAEATIREGRAVMQRGLLSEADGGILYVDDVNLMDQRMLASLLDCVSSGRVVVEREGVSGEYRCDTLMIATMNPGDTDISPHLLDRFDLCAYSDFPDDDVRGREEILRRNSAFAGDPEGFVSMYADEESELRERIAHAARILPLVTISDDLLGVAVELAAKVSADGFRGDIAMAETASALAALNGRDEVLRKDVEEAAMICLAHRRNYSQPPTPPEPPRQDRDEEQDRYEEPPQGPSPDDGRDDSLDGREEPSDLPQDLRDMLDEMMFEIGEQFRVIDYLQDGRRVIRTTSSRKGRRAMAESKDSTGRYARSRIPEGRVSDVAFDATVRAAAPYQRGRDHGTLAIAIEKQDIRRKVRERRSGCTILFLVDASGSLGVRRRMAAVKGAVLSMLRDSYVKRDRIGMMAFRRDSAELILPPTRSVEYSYRKLEGLPTGGRTPLGQALITVNEFMTSYSRSHPGESCYIVLITDGRANVPLREGADANEEARELAADMTIPQVRWIVVDASTGYIRFDNAERLAEELEGTYFRLEDLNADRLAESVRSVIGRSRRVRKPGIGCSEGTIGVGGGSLLGRPLRGVTMMRRRKDVRASRRFGHLQELSEHPGACVLHGCLVLVQHLDVILLVLGPGGADDYLPYHLEGGRGVLPVFQVCHGQEVEDHHIGPQDVDDGSSNLDVNLAIPDGFDIGEDFRGLPEEPLVRLVAAGVLFSEDRQVAVRPSQQQGHAIAPLLFRNGFDRPYASGVLAEAL